MSEGIQPGVESEKSIEEMELDDEIVYRRLLERSGGSFAGDPDKIAELEPVYRQLHTIGMRMGLEYKKILDQYGGRDPGIVDVVLGGGRVKGTPHKPDSDLDIFMLVDNFGQSMGMIPYDLYPGDPLAAWGTQLTWMESLKGEVRRVCEELDVINNFHIMGFGAKRPEEYSEERELLLARVSEVE